MTAFPHFPADETTRPDEDWFIEAKDKDPRDEFARQSAFVNWMRKHSSAIVYHVPNGGRLSNWLKVRLWKLGVIAGALDLEIKWAPGKCFVAEFKDGRGMPTPDQRDMLNRLYRAEVPCGVYRTKETLIRHLRAAGAFDDADRSVGAFMSPLMGRIEAAMNLQAVLAKCATATGRKRLITAAWEAGAIDDEQCSLLIEAHGLETA